MFLFVFFVLSPIYGYIMLYVAWGYQSKPGDGIQLYGEPSNVYKVVLHVLQLQTNPLRCPPSCHCTGKTAEFCLVCHEA